ncbi:LysM peptidoglycan-binding domain-containing protein [Cellulomonas sp. P22]|uniref:LysM peptidoglycan-binding domain-containing protein n=1 Tax=Cellulomonas sp. P22 TaxID=3373189 RepID=UPI003794B3BD
MTATSRPAWAGRTLGLLALPVGLATTLGLTVVIAGRLRTALEPGLDLTTLRIDRAVLVAVLGAGTLLAAWLALSLLVATLCAVARTCGTAWGAGERVVQRWAPALVRRTLTLALGASLGLGFTAAAQATSPDLQLGWAATGTSTSAPATTGTAPEAAPVDTASVHAAPTSTRPTGTPAGASSTGDGDAASVGTPASVPVSDGQVVVAAGDSLWRIAARYLGPGASTADIAAAWPDWYAANAAVIGDDPGLLHPGQVLTLPATASTSTAPAEPGSAS